MSKSIPPGEDFASRFLAVVQGSNFGSLGPEERIKATLSVRSPQDVRFSSRFMEDNVKLVSFKQTGPQSSTATFRFRVDRFYCNASDNLHGGAQATIFDMLTSMTVTAIGRQGWWLNAGVSRSLDVTYLRPAPEGVYVLCEVELMSAGKTLSFMRGTMKREDNGALISVAKHDKAAVATKPMFDGPAKL